MEPIGSGGTRAERRGPRMILVLSDGIRGHLTQSRGIALWLRRLCGAPVEEADVPRLSGLSRIRAKVGALRLASEGNRRNAREWLLRVGGGPLLGEVEALLRRRGISEADSREVLLLSAGSLAAPFNLALGCLLLCKSATIMTPSGLGTEPFDFAVVPEHDFPPPASNVLTTLGAPNGVEPGGLDEAAAELSRRFPPRRERRFGVLLGGDDANYRVSPEFVRREIGRVLRLAERVGADVYLTTSRRTSREAEAAVERLGRSPAIRMLLCASREPWNPVPGMMGLCTSVFCTEDSVSMVSEAATAGHRVILLRVERSSGGRARLSALVRRGVRAGVLPRKALFGAERFDQTFDRMRRKGLLEEWGPEVFAREEGVWPDRPPRPGPEAGFDEARRAAEWILDGWRL